LPEMSSQASWWPLWPHVENKQTAQLLILPQPVKWLGQDQVERLGRATCPVRLEPARRATVKSNSEI
jgi:hypothetical protein